MVALAKMVMEWHQDQQDPLCWVFLALVTLVLVRLRQRHSNLPLPPGPRPLPIIGNMTIMMRQLTHRGLAALAEQYGGLMHLRLGRRHTFVVSTPEYAREVLQAQDHAFSNRPTTIAIMSLTYGRADMAFAQYGPFWRQTRKLMVMKLFSQRRAETWLAVRDESAALVRAVASRSGEVVDLREQIFNLTKKTIFRAAFGTHVADDYEGLDEFIGVFQEFFQLMPTLGVGDFLPWLSWMDPQGMNRKLRATRDALEAGGFIDKIIDDHMRWGRKPTDADADMVDEMLASLYETKPKGSKPVAGDAIDDRRHSSLRLTHDNIKAIIMDVMFGGTETAASSIEWAMTEMLRSPNELQRLQQELASVVGLDRNVTESDLNKLPFLTCIVKETLRMHPPIPILLHATAKDCVVGNYSVPRGSHVMVNVWAIGRDRSVWKDPDVFRPSRFAAAPEGDAAGLEFTGSCFEFLPFGSGRRSCPGMALGQYMVKLAIAQLVHGFDWALPGGMKPSDLDVSDVFGLSAPCATRLCAVPTPRLTCPL